LIADADPLSILTWTGRGKKPRRVTDWLAKGKTMKALAV
jgi:DNA-binding protein H-NS